MAEWRLYKIAQLSLLIEVLTEVEVYRILKDKLACASTLAAVPCSRPNPRRYRVATTMTRTNVQKRSASVGGLVIGLLGYRL
jgi:hypothetical protein